MSGADRGESPVVIICQQISALTQAVQRLQDGYGQVESHLQKFASGQNQANAMSAFPPEPRVPTPDRFSGDREKFKSFKMSCLLYFDLQPRTFFQDSVKVKFAISLLRNEPQTWAHNLFERKDIAVNSINAFFNSMSLLYDDPQSAATAELALHSLRQGRHPVEDYTVKFRRWAADLEWNEAALRYQYRLGLSETIKDELARTVVPTSLEDLIQLAIQLDRRLRERQREKSQDTVAAWESPKTHIVPSTTLPLGGTMDTGSRPVQRGHSPLPQEERARRRHANLCMYCGGLGHFLRNCPVRPNKPFPKVPVDLQVSGPVLSHLLLPISLQVAKEGIQLQAIIDSGACSCFLDLSLARKLGVPLVPKEQALAIYLADGSLPSSGSVTLETIPLLVTSISGHSELMRFDAIDSPIFPVIFGMPWLKAHNPTIDWLQREIKFSSPYCLGNCLKEAPKDDIGVLATMPSTQVTQLVPQVYQEFSDVFDEKKADILPPHRSYDCPIELLPGSEIPFGRIFPLSEAELETLRSYIKENLEKGFIRPSSSPAGAGIFFVEKKDKSLRPCIDYRALNKITIKNRYPLPLIPELFQRFRTAKIFTKLDLRGAYNLVRIREGDEWKTAFRSRFGHFEYLVMPFGLCNAPATFQHLVNDIFREFLDHFMIVYLDDILIFSANLDLHRSHVKKVLATLRSHGLYIKAEKCEFEVTSIHFLGFVISTEGIAMDSQKIKAILDWPPPSDRKGIQRFVGFANFYRRFIKDFSTIIAPVTQLTRQHTRFVWSTEAQEAFDRLKALFVSAPVLQHPDPVLPYVLEVDASEVATGAILSQRQGLKSLLHPVAFFSRKMSPPERNYDVGDRELLAIKSALEEWRYLLEGAAHPIMIFTDHKNLEYLRTAKRLRPRQARWALFFSRFNFHISYRPGSKNGKADALSRMFSVTQEENVPDTILSPQNFLLLQPDLKTAITQASAQCSDPGATTLRKEEGFLWHQDKIFVPLAVRLQVLKTCHDHCLAGHFGAHKTIEVIRRKFWWPTLRQDCIKYIDSCIVCQRNKGPSVKAWGLLRPLSVPEQPWKEISMDFVVELPPSLGYTTILVVVDRLSKMAHFIPMSGTPSSADTATAFVREIVRLHGLPSNITSDRGVQFTSRFWRDLCNTLAIRRSLSSAYHPQSNGQTERTNQTLEQYLRCFCSFSQDDWASLLPCAEFAYNNSVHSTTDQSPFWANYGYHPAFLPDTFPESTVPAVQDRVTAIRTNFQMLQENMKKAQEKFKMQHDRGRKENPIFKVGDKVWLSTTNLRLKCPSKKLGPKFIGPFAIRRVINPVAFELELPNTYKIHPVFHVSLLKAMIPDPFLDRGTAPPPPVSMDSEEEFEVEAIVDCRKRGSRTQFLIKWKGYPIEENSWEPAENIHAPRLLKEFRTKFPEKWARLGIRRLPLRGGHCQRNLRSFHCLSRKHALTCVNARARARVLSLPTQVRQGMLMTAGIGAKEEPI